MKKTLAGIGAGVALLGGGTVTADHAINPYKSVGTTLELQASSTLPEAGTDKIIADKTEPKITLSKWGGEVSMGVKYEGLQSAGDRPFLSKNVTWTQDSKQSMEAVPLDATTTMEDGGMEINVVLNSKPASNKFNFSIDGAENLDFFYQASLWQEAGLKAPTAACTDTQCGVSITGTSTPLVVRDENVVGSYSVYYKNHKNHIAGKTNYGTGKAFQIYRPKVTDNNGNSVWADLSYSSGILIVTVPQSFLNTAAYPVKIDPTFGYTTAGATQTNANTIIRGSLFGIFTAVGGEVVTNIQAYERCNNSANGYAAETAIYSISAGLPATRVGTSHAMQNIAMAVQTLISVASTPTSDTLTGGTTYGVAFSQNGSVSCNANAVLYSDTTSGTQSSTNSATGALPSSWSSASTNSVQYSVFATYTTAPATANASDFSATGQIQVTGQLQVN